jgi:hypothetical protein
MERHGGTSDAQGGDCADAEPALMAPHKTMIRTSMLPDRAWRARRARYCGERAESDCGLDRRPTPVAPSARPRPIVESW